MFDFLDYRNNIPISKVKIGDIPRLNPNSSKFKGYWKGEKRNCIEGRWVEHDNIYRWVSGPLHFYVNHWHILLNKKGSKSKTKSLGKPFLRDLEWIKTYIYATARGFSGFEGDDHYSCHRALDAEDVEFEVEMLEEHVRVNLYSSNGELKKYKPALEYLYEDKKLPLGKALFQNMALNVIDVESRGLGKSYLMAALCAHNFLFDGAMDYDEYLEMWKEGTPLNSETLIGAIDTKYSSDLISKIKLGLDNLEGGVIIGGISYPAPLSKKTTGSYESGKDLREDTLLYSENGPKPIKDVEIGERIYDDSGRLTTITNKYSFTDQLQYKVTLQDGREIYCGEGHQWGVYQNKKYKVISLRGMLDSGYIKHYKANTYWKYRVPLTKPIEFDTKQLPIDPYFLGLWLGDGCSRVTSICTIDPETVDYTYEIAARYNLQVRAQIDEGKCPIYHIHGTGGRTNKLRLEFEQLDLLSNKHIPEEYFYGDINQRLELLRGLMDTDGSCSSNGTIEFCNTNNRLADDLVRLCHTLGIRCNRQLKNTSWTYKGIRKTSTAHRIYLNTELPVFKLERKLCRIKNTLSDMNRTSRASVAIVKIEPTEIRPSYCITVDNSSHLFIAGDYIVTHNTLTQKYEVKVGGSWEWRGSMSKFQHRSFNDNPFAANGTRPGFSVLDEIGFFYNLEPALGQMAECTADGSYKFGSIWMTGTGGDMEGGATEAAKRVFYDPKANSCMEFDDIFEGSQTKIGLFVPAWMGLNQFKDELGNTNRDLAMRFLTMERERKMKAKSKKPLNDELQQRPIKPSEAFLISGGNIFDSPELTEHLKFLETSTDGYIKGRVGKLVLEGVNYVTLQEDFSGKVKPCDYPIQEKDDLEGAVQIWKTPLDVFPDGNIPYGAILATLDPYAQDEAPNSVSLGSMQIFARSYIGGQVFDEQLAEYTGRASSMSEFFETCRKLLIYYNALCLYENNYNQFKTHMQNKNSLHYLAKTPTALKNNKSDSVANTYGLRMTGPMKDELEKYTADWLITSAGDGKLNLHHIYSVPLLKELKSYNDTGNFDRVIALCLFVAQKLQMAKIVSAQNKEKKKSWWLTHKFNGV